MMSLLIKTTLLLDALVLYMSNGWYERRNAYKKMRMRIFPCKAKGKGKNQYALFTPIMKADVAKTMEMTNSLHELLEQTIAILLAPSKLKDDAITKAISILAKHEI